MAEIGNMKWQGGPMFRKCRQWGSGRSNSGNPTKNMVDCLVKVARGHTVVVWCSDQHRNQGTGYRGKFTGKIKGVNISHVAPQAI